MNTRELTQALNSTPTFEADKPVTLTLLTLTMLIEYAFMMGEEFADSSIARDRAFGEYASDIALTEETPDADRDGLTALADHFAP